jgi:3-methyladenine DNA glycosylase AlkD
MPKPQALATEVREYCAAHANPKLSSKYARYFTEGYDAWGILDKDHPLFHQQQDEWLERYGALGLRGFLQAGELLLESGKYEEGSMAIRFLAARRDELDAKSLPALARWFQGVRNWAHADVLCGEVISPALVAGQIAWKDLGPWRDSPHKFQRRAVPVALLGLLKTKQAIGPLLAFLPPLMLDPERVVHQGLGWFLREAWKKTPAPVEAYLAQWKDTAPRLIFQYATEKMSAADRARFRRAKSR